MGDTIKLHQCDNCYELIDGGGRVYWSHRDFTICLTCLLKLSKHVTDQNETEISKKVKPSISNTTRWRIWERDNFTCGYCGSRSDLTIDHIHPVFLGGSDDDINLLTACRRCNSKKGIKSQAEFQG